MSSDAAYSTPVYKRVLLKLSGEALMGDQQFGVDPAVVARIAEDVRGIQKMGVETDKFQEATGTLTGLV